MINIEGLDKAEVLAALYNAAKPLGMGHLHYIPGNLRLEEAKSLLDTRTYFDYLMGRVMKVDLKSDKEFDPRLYDRDNGNGAAFSVIEKIRK